jgi:hypothetical protein
MMVHRGKFREAPDNGNTNEGVKFKENYDERWHFQERKRTEKDAKIWESISRKTSGKEIIYMEESFPLAKQVTVCDHACWRGSR